MIFWKKATKIELKLLRAISIIFRKDPYLFLALFDPDEPVLSDSIENLLEFSGETFSAQQDILFRVAMDVWSGGGQACVWELIEYLDDARLRDVLEALRFLGTKFNGWDGPVCRQLKTDSDKLRRQLKLDIQSDI
jgi:hypothetical protein